ncbi:MAG: SGNH hydrolase domain-containing protein, partial [Leucobacter sp.]
RDNFYQWNGQDIRGLRFQRAQRAPTSLHPRNHQPRICIGESGINDGIEDSLSVLTAHRIPTVLFRDNPRFTFDAFICLEQEEDPSACAVTRSRALADSNPIDALVRPGIATVDMTDFICPDESCPTVIGNIAVYIDDNHLSITYTQTMTPMLHSRLLTAMQEAMSWSEHTDNQPEPDPTDLN